MDPEFGTNEDLKIFVRKAHENSLLVMFDLVYLHCGRSAVFIKEHPDFVIRNEDGTVWIADRWPFARLNYQNAELRKYLLQNMQTLLDEFECDGFRCDVGDSVPLDFWRDSFAKLKERHADLVTLNEGINPEYIQEVFDMGYKYDWNRLMIDIFANDTPAYELKNTYEKEKMQYGENIVKLIRTIDTHDVASDAGLNRNEIIMTSKGAEAALVITNTYDEVPFLWNGYELCDDAENNVFKPFLWEAQCNELVKSIYGGRNQKSRFYKGNSQAPPCLRCNCKRQDSLGRQQQPEGSRFLCKSIR